ncbi:MAG: [FeFe] hydrogenase H-cluster maturation GTPase HydF [Bacteroidetes bacterium HGW-Bacteroidetes-21]|jgi:[FeFe] hydrogenase H-cluster maturation GTPase HydF|nr:MAG: [FeFe] hydrogenase H-cluster maturation GTPase HydF [Bacteroidetes bacterium HGW-Bacteroidetes-21]
MSKGKELKPHIGIFGRRNVGKSSFINAITNTDTAIVSEVAGTTTDPVKKSMEIFGVGPAIIVDTAGIDDTGSLGEKRIAKSLQTIQQIDCAILILTDNTFGDFELSLINQFGKFDVPYLFVHNKADKETLKKETIKTIRKVSDVAITEFSSLTREHLDAVIEAIKGTIPETAFQKATLLGGIIERGDIVMLITPVDSEAPDGRMILPQAMAIRDVLDNHAINVVVKETEAALFLEKTGIKPKLVVTDSQVFAYVSKIIPPEIPLTGFSVAYAHMRGPFEEYVKGARKLSALNNGDRILILESCTHQVSCEDIGRFKIPKWVREYSKKELEFDISAGLSEIARPMTDYALVIQCGGCMITKKQLASRLRPAMDAGVPVTNYGIAIACMNGILDRAVEPFLKIKG